MEQNLSERRSVAYFPMEIGIDEKICTYSGGLGVLAGDTIRSAADLKVSMVAITLLYRKGYFRQRLAADGWQREEPSYWAVDELLQEEPPQTWVPVEGRTVHLRAWRYDVEGVSGYMVPIFFLDAALPENSDWDRGLTQSLYGGDAHYRISQQVILGIGGVRMLRALGHKDIPTPSISTKAMWPFWPWYFWMRRPRALEGNRWPERTWKRFASIASSPPTPLSLTGTTSFL
jgi:glycogen phosphorylase